MRDDKTTYYKNISKTFYFVTKHQCDIKKYKKKTHTKLINT